MWVLAIKAGFSGRAASTLSRGAISQSPYFIVRKLGLRERTLLAQLTKQVSRWSIYLVLVHFVTVCEQPDPHEGDLRIPVDMSLIDSYVCTTCTLAFRSCQQRHSVLPSGSNLVWSSRLLCGHTVYRQKEGLSTSL